MSIAANYLLPQFGQLASSQICKFHTDECKNYTSHNCLTLPTSPNDSFRGLIFCSSDEDVITKGIFSDVKGNKGKLTEIS